jgi:hypothetical protein
MRCPEGPPDGSACRAACDDRWVADGARGRREAVRQLADLRRRLAAAEDAVTDALAAMKQAEGVFDAASDRFDAAERAIDAARGQRAQPGGTGMRPGRPTSGPARPRTGWPGACVTSPSGWTAGRVSRESGRGAHLIVPYGCSNRRGGSAVSCVVALPRAVRERARVGPWTGAGVLAAVPLRERPDAASRPGHLGTLHGRLPRAGVPVGVVRPAARARPGGVKGPGTSPTLPSQRFPGGQVGRRAHGAPG